MDIGIGLPNAISGTTGRQLLDWARRAEDAGFSTLATIGAVAYPGHEELTALAAAGAVTDRIGLLTNILVAPPRSAAELAKQAATADQISDGRLTLGLAPGWRAEDFAVTGRDYAARGERFDEQLVALQRAWDGEAIDGSSYAVSPTPAQGGGIPLLIGGTTEAAVRRVVEHGTGWTAGGMPPDAVEEFAQDVRSAWDDAGRDGAPRIVALAYFGLGDTEQESRSNILDYYQRMGEDTAQMIADSAMRSVDAITGALQAFEDAGVDEFILDPSVGDPRQVDLLADVVF